MPPKQHARFVVLKAPQVIKKPNSYVKLSVTIWFVQLVLSLIFVLT